MVPCWKETRRYIESLYLRSSASGSLSDEEFQVATSHYFLTMATNRQLLFRSHLLEALFKVDEEAYRLVYPFFSLYSFESFFFKKYLFFVGNWLNLSCHRVQSVLAPSSINSDASGNLAKFCPLIKRALSCLSIAPSPFEITNFAKYVCTLFLPFVTSSLNVVLHACFFRLLFDS